MSTAKDQEAILADAERDATFEERMIATIICALRDFQENKRWSDYCEHLDGVGALDGDEIDQVIEELNLGRIEILPKGSGPIARSITVNLPHDLTRDDVVALWDWVKEQETSDSEGERSVGAQEAFLREILAVMPKDDDDE